MRNTVPVLNMGVALLVFLAFGAAAVPDVLRDTRAADWSLTVGSKVDGGGKDRGFGGFILFDIPLGRKNQAIGQAAVRFPMRSGDEVALSFSTPEELPR